MTDFSGVKKGDKVGITHSWHDPKVVEVTHVTLKFFDADGARYEKNGGWEWTSRKGVGARRQAVKIDEAFRRQADKVKARSLRYQLAKRLDETEGLPLATLKQIAVLLDSALEADK